MMDFRLEPSRGWQAVVILYAVLTVCQGQFPPQGPSPVLDETPVTVRAKVGTKAILPCHVLNSGLVGVMWNTKDFEKMISNQDQVLIDSRRYSVDTSYQDEWNLVIDPVREDDAGIYVCMTQTLPPQLKEVTLIVPSPPTIDRSALSPKFSIMEGDRLYVKCVATGYPEPEIRWFKYTPDPSSQQERKELVSNTDTLDIPRLKRGDGNIYGCIAENGQGKNDMYEIFVDVIYKPEVSTATRNIKVKHLDTVKLECITDSHPPGKSAWYRNGKQLHTSWKYFVENLDNLQSETKKTLRLTIRQIELDDTGDYTCTASNSVGESHVDISVSIQLTTTTTTAIPTTETTTTTTATTKATTKPASTPLDILVPQTGESQGGGSSPAGQSSIARLIVSLVLTLVAIVVLS